MKTNHLQVLVDDETQKQVNRLIMLQAIARQQKPQTTSSYIRELIELEIQKHEVELKFFSKDMFKQANNL